MCNYGCIECLSDLLIPFDTDAELMILHMDIIDGEMRMLRLRDIHINTHLLH